jgi:hypothetical protein
VNEVVVTWVKIVSVDPSYQGSLLESKELYCLAVRLVETSKHASRTTMRTEG